MNIDVIKLRKYDKILRNFSKKGSASKSVYIDLQKGCLYFSDTQLFGRITFQEPHEAEDNTYKGYVDLLGFLALVNQYDDLEVNEDLEFSSGEENFKLKNFDGEFTPLDIDSIETGEAFTIHPDIAQYLATAISYMGVDGPKRNQSAISFQSEEGKTRLLSTDSTCIFISDISGMIDDSFILPDDAANICIQALSQNITPKISIDQSLKGRLVLTTDDGIMSVVFSKDNDYFFPSVFDASFISKFATEESIQVGKYDLLDVLKFYAPFTSGTTNQHLELKVVGEKEIAINAVGDMRGTRILSVVEVSPNLIGTEFLFSRDMLLKSIHDIHDDFISISYSEDSPAFSVKGVDNGDVIIAIVKLV